MIILRSISRSSKSIKKYKNKTKEIGKRYNFSLVAEVLALVFLALSEHPMNTQRWVIAALLLIFTIISFIANE